MKSSTSIRLTKDLKKRIAEVDAAQPKRLEEVTWLDACTYFEYPAGMEDDGGFVRQTVGWILAEGPTCLSLCAEGGEGANRHGFEIPTTLVLRRRRLT